MKKRIIVEICSTIGSPAARACLGAVGCIYGNLKVIDLFWIVPLGLISFPLLPIYMMGEGILRQCDIEDFDKRTSHLPRIKSLSSEYVSIHHQDSRYYIEPLFWLSDNFLEFTTEELARQWLLNNEYYEVINESSGDNHYMYGTYWIKKE